MRKTGRLKLVEKLCRICNLPRYPINRTGYLNREQLVDLILFIEESNEIIKSLKAKDKQHVEVQRQTSGGVV